MTAAADWAKHGACLTGDPDLFHPDGNRVHAARQANAARRVCRACPVRQECAAEALAREGDLKADQRHGIWGGLTPRERAAIAQREAGGDAA